MSKEQKPETTYTITEHNYNILNTQLMEIHNMLLRRDHHILIESALEELSVAFRVAIQPTKQK